MAEEKVPEAGAAKAIVEMTAEARAHALHACRRILRPLVKILIRAGVRFDEFCETVKGVYIESAVRDGLGPLGKGTRARITHLTGISRRDVDRYIDDPSLLAGPRKTLERTLTEIIHLWHTDPLFQGPYGLPLELDFVRTNERSFSALVRRVDPQSDPTLLATELLRARVVVGSVEKFLKIVSRTYVVPTTTSLPMLEHFGNALSNLANTISHNSEADALAKRLERSVFPDRGLPLSMVPSFQKMARSLVQQFIKDVDDWVADNIRDQPPFGTEAPVDIGITIFEYIRSEKPQPPLQQLMPPDK